MSVAVVTSIYGGYDQLQPPPPQLGVSAEWVCVTDNPDLAGNGWRIVHEPRPNLTPRLAAKVAKCLPYSYVHEGHEMVVWMDGSCHLREQHTLALLLDHTQPGDTSQFQHPHRGGIYTEAEFSAPLPKYAHQPILEQAAAYRKDGHPEGWGLWCTGFIAYRTNRAICELLGYSWLIEQIRWTDQDQISQPYVWWRAGLRPTILPGALGLNDYVTWTPHADGT